MEFTEDIILRYLDKKLSKGQEEEFLAAMNADNELADLVEHHRSIHQALLVESLAKPSPGFTERVMQSVVALDNARSRFFNQSRIFVICLISIVVLTTLYYFSTQFYPSLGGAIAEELTIRQFTVDLTSTRRILDSDSLFKIVFYVNGVIGLLLLDRAILKPYFARRRERYSI